MVTYGKNITIWIFEPRHLVTCGCCPNAKFVILNKRIFFEGNASFAQPSDDRFDVLHFPAQNGALGWSEILDFCNPNLVPADAHDQRILIDAHKLKSKLAFIKSPRFVVIPCGNKAALAPSGIALAQMKTCSNSTDMRVSLVPLRPQSRLRAEWPPTLPWRPSIHGLRHLKLTLVCIAVT